MQTTGCNFRHGSNFCASRIHPLGCDASSSPLEERTVRPKTHSELIPKARTSNSNHVNNWKHGQILNWRKNGGIIRPTVFFFFFRNMLGWFIWRVWRVFKHFWKNHFSFTFSFTSISLHLLFHFPFHLSSFSSCLFFSFSSSLSSSSWLFFSLSSSLSSSSCLFSCISFFSLFFILSLLLSFFFSLVFSYRSSLLLSCLSSFIFSCLLVLSRLLLSCIVLSSFVFSSLCPSLCLCLCFSPCGVVVVLLCCGVCGVVWRVVWCVMCGTVKTPVCRLKTCPCISSTRPCVHRHHAHMLKHMCAWFRYTRWRFERTHGLVFFGHTAGRVKVIVSSAYQICPHRVITWPRSSPKVTTGSDKFTVWKSVENNTCPIPLIILFTWRSCSSSAVLRETSC